MEIVQKICQLVIGLGILNVWILRFGKKTPYRGGDSASLKEEFAAYGLPGFMVWVVGALKLGAALALLGGLAVPLLVKPAAIVMVILMLGAAAMHAKVKDPLKKYLPAVVMLVLSAFLVATS